MKFRLIHLICNFKTALCNNLLSKGILIANFLSTIHIYLRIILLFVLLLSLDRKY